MKKTLSFIIIISMIWQQSGFSQIAPQLPLPAYLLKDPAVADKFHPVHLRSLSFSGADSSGSFSISIDTGDAANTSPEQLAGMTKKLIEYFKVGLALPDESFWVNLRPDSPYEIIDPYLEKTDVGKVLLEADLRLKRDLAAMTDPGTAEGKKYWKLLYKKAAQVYSGEDAQIPAVMRPWIVPGEIVIGESREGAYVYKASLSVMLEQDYLKTGAARRYPGTNAFAVGADDARFNEMNAYSTKLIKELILPRLIRSVNVSERYAALRQVYYSLILAQWVKSRAKLDSAGPMRNFRCDTRDLTGLTSENPWSKDAYYKEYKKSFEKGEYRKEDIIDNGYAQVIRQYASGGVVISPSANTLITEILPRRLEEQFLISVDTVGTPASRDGGVLLSDSELQARYKAALDSLDALLQEPSPDVEKVLTEFFICAMIYGHGEEYKNNPGLFEHVLDFVNSVKDLPGIDGFINPNQWFLSDRLAYNPILEILFGAYASLYHNARRPSSGQYEQSYIGYYEQENVPELAKVIMPEIVRRIRRTLAGYNIRPIDQTALAALRAELNSKHPIAVVRTATGKLIPLSTALNNAEFREIPGDGIKVYEICTKENLDKTGRKQFRVRETTYYSQRPKGIVSVTTPEGFFKQDWPDDPSIWTSRVRGVLQKIAELLPEDRDFFMISEGGLYKGTMTGQTDIDTVLHIDLSRAIDTSGISRVYEEWKTKNPKLLDSVKEKVDASMRRWEFKSQDEQDFWKKLNTVFMLLCIEAGVGMPSEALRMGILPADAGIADYKIDVESEKNEDGFLITTKDLGQFLVPRIGYKVEEVIVFLNSRGSVLGMKRGGIKRVSGVKLSNSAAIGTNDYVVVKAPPGAEISLKTSNIATCSGIALRGKAPDGTMWYALAHVREGFSASGPETLDKTHTGEVLTNLMRALREQQIEDIRAVIVYDHNQVSMDIDMLLERHPEIVRVVIHTRGDLSPDRVDRKKGYQNQLNSRMHVTEVSVTIENYEPKEPYPLTGPPAVVYWEEGDDPKSVDSNHDGGTALDAKSVETLAKEITSDQEETRKQAVDFAREILSDEDLLAGHEGEVKAYFSRLRAEMEAVPDKWLDFVRELAMPIVKEAIADLETMETLVEKNPPDGYELIREAANARLSKGLNRLEGLFDRLSYTPERFSLPEFLQDMADAHPDWPKMVIRVESGIDPEISSFKEALRDIVTNWMVNASKYAGEGSTVMLTIRAADSSGLIVLEYEDTGPGLTKDALAFLTNSDAPAPKKRASAGVHSSHQGRQIVFELLNVLGGEFIDAPPEPASPNGDLMKAKWSISLGREISAVWKVDVGAKYSSIKHDIANARAPLTMLLSDLLEDSDSEAYKLNEKLKREFDTISWILPKQDLHFDTQSGIKDGGIVKEVKLVLGEIAFFDERGNLLAMVRQMPYNNIRNFDQMLFIELKESISKYVVTAGELDADNFENVVAEIVQYTAGQVINSDGVHFTRINDSLDTLLENNIVVLNRKILYRDETGRLSPIDISSQSKHIATDLATSLKNLFDNALKPNLSALTEQRRKIGSLVRDYMRQVRQERELMDREKSDALKKNMDPTGPGTLTYFEKQKRAKELVNEGKIPADDKKFPSIHEEQMTLGDFGIKDGGKKGGIDFRALPINTKPVMGGVSVGTGPLPNMDIAQARINIKNMLSAGGMPYKEIKEYMLYCKQINENEALSEMAGFLARVLRAEEDAGLNMELPMKELLAEL